MMALTDRLEPWARRFQRAPATARGRAGKRGAGDSGRGPAAALRAREGPRREPSGRRFARRVPQER